MSIQYIVAEFFSKYNYLIFFVDDFKNRKKDLTKSHFLENSHNIHEVKHEAYVEKWKRLISAIKKDEEGEFISIKPSIDGRMTIL